MKKLFIYPDNMDNNSLGQLAHLLINKGFSGFSIGISRLEFDVHERDLDQLKNRINGILQNENFRFSVK